MRKAGPVVTGPALSSFDSNGSLEFFRYHGLVFGLPADAQGRTGILVIVDTFSKMVHLSFVTASITAEDTAALFVDQVFKHHGMLATIVSDRDPRFIATFWSRLFGIFGTRLMMSTTAHPETDGQTDRVNRMLEDVLRSYAAS